MAWKFNPHTNRLDFFGSLSELLDAAWQQDEAATRQMLQAFVYVGSAPPSDPRQGTLWFDTTNAKILKIWSGSEWLVPDVVLRHETTGELYQLTVVTDPDSAEAVLRLTKL